MIQRMKHCDLHGSPLPPEAFNGVLSCEHCNAEIPLSAAVTFEGSDYVWHFRGQDCLAKWCEKTRAERH